jgi:hypothetical protein
MNSLSPALRAALSRFLRFSLRPGSRRALTWLALIICTGIAVMWALDCYDVADRRDGNHGHATIDFGGQWVMGRMLVTGNGRALYNRLALRRVLEEAYPRADSDDPRIVKLAASGTGAIAAADSVAAGALLAAAERVASATPLTGKLEADVGDAQRLLDWMIGEDRPEDSAILAGYLGPLAGSEPIGSAALMLCGQEHWREIGPQRGGPLYPPVNSYYFAPLGLLPPRPAYRVMQAVNLVLIFAIAVLAQRISGGRVWWQVAAMLLMGCPGFSGALNLGQNALLSLFLLMLGWRQLQRGRDVRAGTTWGLLVFKPVWAAAFFLVPVLTRRWRMAAAMAATGMAVSALTLPVVGWHSWTEWLSVGARASDVYGMCETWIYLSRDLIGLPRRYLLSFTNDYAAPDDRWAARATAIGLALWLTPLFVTIAAMIRRGPREARISTGPQAAFVLFGAWLACYHFMYYDVLLAYLPCCLLYAEPRRVARRVVNGMPPGTWLGLTRSAAATVLLISLSAVPYFSTRWDPTYHFPPWDTFCVVLLWLWCDLAHGQRPLHAAQGSDGGGGINRTHEGLADQDGTHAGRAQSFDILPAANATFADQADARRNVPGNIQRMFQPGVKRP